MREVGPNRVGVTMRETAIMASPTDDERLALIEALRAALIRARGVCARAEIACQDARAIRGSHIRENVASSRIISPRGAARLKHDLDNASRDLEMLKAKIESAKQATLTPRPSRRR